jgi:hypothetical protein
MVLGWDSAARSFVGFGLGLDYVYLLVYSTTLGLASVMLGATLRDRGAHKAADLARPIAWMQWLAAGFDAIENAALLDTLTWRGAPRFSDVSWVSASAKFTLVAIGVVYLVAGGLLALWRRSSASPQR